MSYVLDSTTIRNPHSIREENSTQVAEHRTLSGNVSRDYFGTNKRVWILEYENTKKADYDTINTIYTSYLNTVTAKSWAITETNYAVSSVNVHVDLKVRSFRTKGTDYISDFTLILTEA